MFVMPSIWSPGWWRSIALAALLLFLAGPLRAAGIYQNTKDGKTKVWNSAPKAGDVATWVGDRNREGYASGFGTLTWYTASGKIFARYYGNMVDGKFDGPVNAHSNGRVAHATFTEGTRVSPWAGGKATLRGGFTERNPTPAPKLEEMAKPPVVAPPKKEVKEPPAEAPKKPVPSTPPPAPKAKPVETPKAKPAASTTPLPAPSERPSPEFYPTPAVAPTVKRDVDESLQSLVGPPSSLHSTHPAEKTGNGPLTRDEVLDLANTIARTHGYNPSTLPEPKVEHNESDETWSVLYGAKDGEDESASKHLSVSVDGKTKRATIASEPKDSP